MTSTIFNRRNHQLFYGNFRYTWYCDNLRKERAYDAYIIITYFSRRTGDGRSPEDSVNVMNFFNIPVSLLLGILLGMVTGYGLYLFFETFYAHKYCVRNSMKVIIILGVAFLLIAVEVILFVLVGAAVDIRYMLKAGIAAVLMILTALAFRTIGILLCMVKTDLTRKKRLFCVIAYLPKTTVQAAIGSVPLAAGLPCGEIVLSVAVMAIILTDSLSAIGMDATYQKLLEKKSNL